MSKEVQPQNLTMSQESELNSKAATQEGFEQRMAFETYYKMGDKRSLRAISNKLSKPLITVEKWSSKFRWIPRVKERERQAAEYLLMQKSAKDEAETKQKHLTLVDATIGQWSKKLVEGGIQLKTVDDLQKLVNLRWQLAQMPDKVVNQTVASQGASIDLRLRNMDRTQLNQFLYGTMKSIERVMNRKEPQAVEPIKQGGSGKMNLDIKFSQHDDAPPAKPQNDPNTIEIDPIDITPADLDFDDLDLD